LRHKAYRHFETETSLGARSGDAQGVRLALLHPEPDDEVAFRSRRVDGAGGWGRQRMKNGWPLVSNGKTSKPSAASPMS
jgi:hypothetical protein